MQQPFTVDMAELVDFLREADELGWPNGIAPTSDPALAGFETTRHSRGEFRFVDLYGGQLTDVGFEVVFRGGELCWGAAYRGGILDAVDRADELFGFLVEALDARSPDALPLRGPALFTSEKYPTLMYRHSLRGSIESFVSIEQITDQVEVVYERLTIGGLAGAVGYGAAADLLGFR